VGGIKEKVLAAKRAGIEDILLPKENKKDIDDIPAHYLKGLNFHFVDQIMDVLAFALLEEKIDKPLEIC
jgi:ATP-dependent Lon protease